MTARIHLGTLISSIHIEYSLLIIIKYFRDQYIFHFHFFTVLFVFYLCVKS